MKITKRKLESLIDESLSRSSVSKKPSLVKVYQLGGRPLMFEMAEQMRSAIPVAAQAYDAIVQAQESIEALDAEMGGTLDRWHSATKIPKEKMDSELYKALQSVSDSDMAKSEKLMSALKNVVPELKKLTDGFEDAVQGYLNFKSSEPQWKREWFPKGKVEPTQQYANLAMGEEGIE